MNRRILITGGTGYLGSRIAQHLASEPGIEIVIASRRSYPQAPDWLPNGRFLCVPFDAPVAWDEACQGVTDVLHLASMNASECQRDPCLAMAVNTTGTVQVLEAAKRARIGRLIYMSSAHVYGNLAGKITEETPPQPRSAYAISKRAAEDFVLDAAESSDLQAVVLRLSNVFGAPAHPDIPSWSLLVNDLCRQAVNQGTMRLRSSGIQIRDFIPLADVVRAVRLVLDQDPERLPERIYNLGGENAISIFAMAEAVAARCEVILGTRPAIERPEPQPRESAQPLTYCCDRLKRAGFSSQCPMNEEIDRTLEFCRDLRDAMSNK